MIARSHANTSLHHRCIPRWASSLTLALVCALALFAQVAPRAPTVQAFASRLNPATQTAHDAEQAYPVDSTLRLLRALRQRGQAPSRLASVLSSPGATVSVRLAAGSDVSSLSSLEEVAGVQWQQMDGRLVEGNRIRGAVVPWESLAALGVSSSVERIDSIWKPAVAAPLDASIPAMNADDAWVTVDGSGRAVTGRGVIIADMDTGADVFHPSLWRPDAGSFRWLDLNGNSRLDGAGDAVDLNGNGIAEPQEALRLLDSTSNIGDGIPGTNDGAFTPDLDCLYNDANGNGTRDYGPAQFSEHDPTYGERLFWGIDDNRNGIMEIHERLVGLGSSKVAKKLGAGGVEYSRGIDLIHSSPDTSGHGTSVASVLCGGAVGTQRYTGVAPDSTLLVADIYNNPYTVCLPWAEANGAQVMLYEYGSWVHEFLDGSSNFEQMVDAAASRGIVQVAAAGNLGESGKHANRIVASGAFASLPVHVPFGWDIQELWISILWRGPQDAVPSLQLVTPSGSVTLHGDETWVNGRQGHWIWSARDRSARGTARFDVYIDRPGSPIANGTWTFQLRNNTSSWLNVHGYAADNLAKWEQGVRFDDSVAFTPTTVTSPGTADSAITVASYSTRGRNGTAPGALSPFSSRGPRLDGQSVVDIAAPGHYDIVSAASHDVAGRPNEYRWFSGTSAASAHVAGAAALVLQMDPGTSPAEVQHLFRATARNDAFTGLVPNEGWGYGKLDARAALPLAATPTPTPRARLLLPIIRRQR